MNIVGLSRRRLAWLGVALMVAVLVYRGQFRSEPVRAHTLVRGEVRGEVLGTGTLEARVKTTISPRIQERLAEVLVDQGDPVKAGQLLARLDEAELKQQVAVAQAALAASRATVERVRADEARARAVLQQAQQDHRRVSDLVETRVASAAEFDRAVEALRVAEADLRRSMASVAEAESQVQTADQNLLHRRELLAFTEIRSPYDGLVIRRDRDPGGVVVPGGSLLQIIATNEIWLSAWVDETAAGSLSTGQGARVVFRSEPGTDYPGTVARLGLETDRETREFIVEVRLQQLPVHWTVGQRGEVFIETGRRPGVIVLPSAFLYWRDGEPGVFVNDHGRARWRGITLGLRGLDTSEVTAGLSEGDQVVRPREGRNRPLAEGQRLHVP